MINLKDDIKNALTVLQNGGIILYPTDTIWGIGCDATNAKAVGKVYEIKKRIASKSMIILVEDVRMVFDYVNAPSEKLTAIIEEAISPTTVIFSHAKNFPPNLINDDGSIAIRKTSDSFCKELI